MILMAYIPDILLGPGGGVPQGVQVEDRGEGPVCPPPVSSHRRQGSLREQLAHPPAPAALGFQVVRV